VIGGWSQRRRDVATGVLLGAVAVVMFSDVLFGHARLYIRDLWRYHYPMKLVVRSMILSGEFPWWNPFFAGGQPMAANPAYEVFYPLQWLTLLPSFDFGFQLHIIVHFVVAMVGAFALLRSFRIGRAAAVFGAISLGLGGCSLSLSNLLPLFFCAAWMPAFFYFARRYLVRPGGRTLAFAALVGGVQALVGEPVVLIQTWVLLGSWAAWRAMRRGRPLRRLGRTAVLLALLLAATIGVAAVQLVPALDHASDSNRARPVPYEASSDRSLAPARVAELAVPDLFGRVVPNAYWGGRRLYPRGLAPYIFNLYFGLLGALLAAAMISRPFAGRGFVVSVGAISFLLAIGSATPVYRWLYDVGIVSRFRYPEKWIVA